MNAMLASDRAERGRIHHGLAPRFVRLHNDRPVALRVATFEDAPAVQSFVRGLSDRSRRNRFFSPLRELTTDQLDRVTQSRHPGALAIVAETADIAGSRIVALGQYAVCDPPDAEFAVVVDDAWQRQGLGTRLLELLAEHAARVGVSGFTGFVLSDNWPMLAFLSRFGCELMADRDPSIVRAVKRLGEPEFAI